MIWCSARPGVADRCDWDGQTYRCERCELVVCWCSGASGAAICDGCWCELDARGVTQSEMDARWPDTSSVCGQLVFPPPFFAA